MFSKAISVRGPCVGFPELGSVQMEVPNVCKGLEVNEAAGHLMEAEYFQVFGKGMMLGFLLGVLVVQVSKWTVQGIKSKGKDTGVSVEVNVNMPQDTVKGQVQNYDGGKDMSPKSKAEVRNLKANYDQFTMEVLKGFCRSRGLKVGGLKKDLVERLQEADWAEGR